MSSPFPTSKGGANVPLHGVDQYGGTPDPLSKAGKDATKFDDDVYSTGVLPKGVTEYGGTPSKNEQPTNIKSTPADDSLHGLNQWGGTNNNQQPGNLNSK